MKHPARATKNAVLAATAVVALASCGGGGDTGGSGGGGGAASGEDVAIKIGWVPPNTTGVFNTATDYFERAAEEANQNGFAVEIVTQAPQGGEANTAGLNQIMENMISQDVDVITVSPGDTEAIKPAVRLANEAGIPVVYVNLLDTQEDVDVSAYVGFDNVAAAKVTAYSVLDYYGGPGVLGAGEEVEVPPEQALDLAFWEDLYADVDPASITANGVALEGVKGTIYSNQRLEGFNEVIEGFPGVQLGDVLPGDWDRGKGAEASEDLLASNPTGLDFLWAASNEMALGAVNVLESRDRLDVNATGAERTPEKVAIFTNDNTAESTEAIRQGKIIAETTHGFPDWGWAGTAIAVQLACGEEVEEKTDINPRTVYNGNAGQFYPDPQLPEVDWATIRSECDR